MCRAVISSGWCTCARRLWGYFTPGAGCSARCAATVTGKFMPYGYVNSRENALCPHCLALERHRLMWLYLQNETDFFEAPARVLHIAPEYCFLKRFGRLPQLDYVTADLESPLAKVKMDVQRIPFPDGEFDVIFCNHILEHVDDDRQAMRELFRVMRPGGWGIMLSPVNPTARRLTKIRRSPIPCSVNSISDKKITCAITAGITASAWPKPGSMSKRSTTSVSSVRKRRRCTGCVRK